MPNVSLCAQENEVHYNPLPYQGFCKLTLNDSSTVELEGSGELTYNAVARIYSETLVSAEIGKLCTSIGGGAFASCIRLISVTIPDSVTSIGGGAFGNCSSITNIIIPSGVTSIGGGAFGNCSNLIRVTIEAVNPPNIIEGGNMFEGNAVGRKIYVPSESVNAYKAAGGWSDYASDIEAIPTT